MAEKKDRRPRRRRRPADGAKSQRQPEEQVPQPDSLRQVLASTELLEAILLQLDRRDLLTSIQRVCTLWHSVISTSPSLQRYLFFLADLPTNSPTKISFTPNPLLRDAFPCLYPNPTFMAPAWQAKVGIIPPDAGFVSAGEHNVGNTVDPNEIFLMTDTRLNGKRNLAFIRSNASWRRMLVSQPLPRKVVRVDRGIGTPNKEVSWKLVDFPDGLRMGELFDEIFTINWSRNRLCAAGSCRVSCFGEPAHIAWRVPMDMVKPGERTWWSMWWEGPPKAISDKPPPEWLTKADLVLGEDMGYNDKSDCRHPDNWEDGMGFRCFLWQHGDRPGSAHLYWRKRASKRLVGGKGMKWLFQCNDYNPGGPLSLPPMESREK
ncbi:hypothetical protein OQA88_619 [Cercophora sp. LCS_1]